jgi:ATP-dependent Lon protease
MSDDLLDLDVTTDRPLAVPSELPILPLRDTVLFPNSFMPLAVAREASVRLIDDAMSGAKLIGVFTQRDASIEEPTITDLYTVGTVSHVHKMFKLPDGSLRLIVQGLSRLTLDEITASRPYLRGRVSPAPEQGRAGREGSILPSQATQHGSRHPRGAEAAIKAEVSRAREPEFKTAFAVS